MPGRANPTSLLCLLTLSAALWPLSSANAEVPKKRIVVLKLEAKGAMREGVVDLLNEALLSEFQGTGDFDVFSPTDIASMLEHEQAKQLVGCDDDSCLVEIGGALGAERIVGSAIGRLGQGYVLNMKIIHVGRARVEGRITQVIGSQESELLDGARAAVHALLEGSGNAGRRGGPHWSTWVAGGSAVALLASGIAVGVLAQQDHSDLDNEVRGTPAWRDLKASTEDKSLIADILYGAAGAAAVTTVLLYFFADGSASPAVNASVLPTPGGATASLGLRF